MGYKNFAPIGHFYSLYPNIDEIKENSNRIFHENCEIDDIKLNEDFQIEVFKKMVSYYHSLPNWIEIDNDEKSNYRYRYMNDSFPPSDALALNTMLRILKPNKIIEVGSGWSSAVILDTNEFCLNETMDITFIEPYPQVLKSVCNITNETHNIIDLDLQKVPLEQFDILEEGDILFIDSTHVSKIGSDVNYLFFKILPRLKKGVYIHLHDIFYPFEYPMKWIENGFVLNKLYLLRAFLQNNPDYEVIFFENMLEKKYSDLVKQNWPLDYEIDGGSFWMKKIR